MNLTKKEQTRNTNLMIEIIEYMQKHELFEMVNIYTNGHLYSSDKTDKDFTTKTTKYGEYYDYGTYDVTEQIEYNNPNTITMTFEGPFYNAYNGNYGNYKTEDDIRKICDKYGLYAEQGYAWSLALYE